MSAMRASAAKKASASRKGGGGGEVTLSPLSVEMIGQAVADGVSRVLADLGPKLARVGAADVKHSMEQEETVFRRALDEGDVVSELLDSRGYGG